MLRLKQLKVLVYTNVIGSKTETFIYNEIISLSERNDIQVKVVTTNYLNQEYFPINKVSVIKKRVKSKFESDLRFILSSFGLIFPQLEFGFKRKVNEIIKDFCPDIIHCHFGDIGLEFYLALKKESKNIPFIIHFHGYDASRLLKTSKAYVNSLKRTLKKGNIHSILVSRDMQSRVLKHGVDLSNSSVLYYGTMTNNFKREQFVSRHCTFLQVSSLVEKKGHLYTLQAFAIFSSQVGNPNKYRLIIAGGGENQTELEQFAIKLGIQNKVIFTGWIDVHKAKNLMSEADFFVHHSITANNGDQEGIPNAIMEAMAMELPIISTIHSGIPELVEDGVNGYLVPEKDVNLYAQRMKDILTWGIQKQNREKVLRYFDNAVHIENLIKIYYGVLQR